MGYGSSIIQAATAHICSDPKADAAVLVTEPGLAAIYRRSGWEHVQGLQVVSSEHDEHEAIESYWMMLFLSAAARAARGSFARDMLVLPGDEW
jgi:hypothetical protein